MQNVAAVDDADVQADKCYMTKKIQLEAGYPLIWQDCRGDNWLRSAVSYRTQRTDSRTYLKWKTTFRLTIPTTS